MRVALPTTCTLLKLRYSRQAATKATLPAPPKLRERLKATVLVMQMQYDNRVGRFASGEQGGGPTLANSFNGDADTKAASIYGIADDDFRASVLLSTPRPRERKSSGR